MEHNEISKKLQNLRIDPSPVAWNKIENNLYNRKKKSRWMTSASVAAIFLLVLSITLFRFSNNNSYKVELVNNSDLSENFEFYNRDYSIALSKAYSKTLN